MNGSPQKAADDAISFANKLKPLFGLAEELVKLGSLQQAERELQQKKERAENEAVEAQGKLEQINAQVEAAHKRLAEKQKDLDGLIDAANKNAAKIEADARERAREILADAMESKAEADGMLKDARKKVQEADNELSLKGAELGRVRQQLDGIKAQMKKVMDV